MKTALQEYNDFAPRIGERVIATKPDPFGGPDRHYEGAIQALHPSVAEIEVRLDRQTETERFGPSRLRRAVLPEHDHDYQPLSDGTNVQCRVCSDIQPRCGEEYLTLKAQYVCGRERNHEPPHRAGKAKW